MVKKSQLYKVKLGRLISNKAFLKAIRQLELFVAKVLAIALTVVILVGIVNLIFLLATDLFTTDRRVWFKNILDIFGLFLNILIALELMENLTAYMKKQVIQLELVVVTALIAVARKIIIFDFSKFQNLDLLALGIAIASLSISYWIIRRANRMKA